METQYYQQVKYFDKWVLKPGYYFRVEWRDIDGKFHTDFFVDKNSTKAGMQVRYVHVWDDPEQGLRDFLTHVPLHDLKITVFD